MSNGPGQLDIFILGGRLGESIVVCTPGGHVGVIDAYARDPEDLDTNPTIARLRQIGASRLKFLALTHPHQDHFRGLPGIFQEFRGRISEFWRPPWDKSNWVHLFRTLDVEIASESLYARRRTMWDAASLLRDLIKLAEEARALGMHTKFMQEATPMLSEPEHDFSIRCIAPCADLVLDYQNGLARQVIERSTDGSNGHHNLVSSVLEVRFGTWIGLLGGDTEQRSWRELLSGELASSVANARFVKVAHHGSPTGSFKELWTRVRTRPFDTVVTSFAAQKLPHPRGLQSIWDCGGVIHATTVALVNDLAGGTVPRPSTKALPIHLLAGSSARGEVKLSVSTDSRMTFAYTGAAGRVGGGDSVAAR